MFRWLLVSFVAVMVLARSWPWLSKLGVGRLPGDVTIRIGSRAYPFPFMSTLVLMAIISVIAKLW
ncbi:MULTISPECIES: DUF2905 domain-containing protein [Burkholderia]|jgi:hypothetical protein|uniref:DUF2905 domain-containing protein n=4 Tax=Burkholderia gladioli TaxID=28095 RepID=A0AAP1Y768_BURGA|nr:MULTISPECIES: DUF2905 domain-containing protein [Burkholderia]AEA62269.1 hypothetical protein bgla_1g36660 [Burkholderia gladioli BSR3]AJX00740.1 hypothetical protein BM43_1177 [Burkholderia gladioli]ASD81031.1 DUF2905 domain-containing protein [Burkholderia gladioli pv. gladioli]AWY53735.1 DUF2905 domain-containing protein [Burkholderia gladioli pv. gladioli]AYQ86563.1 DUF2905 domain-containing protein [Burkholderia gladioli]